MTTSTANAPETLVEHAAFVRAVARAVLGGDDLVEDAVQQTWVVALERGETRRGPLRPWLGGVARLTALALRRRRARVAKRERDGARSEVNTSAESSAEALAARAEQGRRVVDAVLRLEDPYRTAILLRYYDDVGPREIARRLDLPYETVRTHLKRGLAKLRDDLAADAPDDESRDWRALLVPLALGGEAPGASPPSLLPLIAGGITVKKIAALITIAVLLLGGALVWRPWEGNDTGRRSPASGETGGLSGLADRADPAHLAGRGEAPPSAEPADGFPASVDFAEIDRERDLHGLVLAPDGTPVAGARLQVLYHPWRDHGFTVERSLYEQTVGGLEALSAEDGSFAFRLEKGELAYLRVEAGGYATVERLRLTAGERVEIRLYPGVSLALNVTAANGEPASGVRVSLYPDHRKAEVVFWLDETTGKDGVARFDGLPPGSSVRLHAAPTADGQAFVWAGPIRLPEAGTLEESLQLLEGWIVTGRVTDAETGRAIADVEVASLWNGTGAVSTDADGRYALPGGSGLMTAAVYFRAPGYGRKSVALAGARTLDVALERGFSVTGRVVDEAGTPIPGAQLRALASRQFQRVTSISADAGRSGPEGRFRLDGLTRDLAHGMAVKAPGFGKTIVDFDPPEAGSGSTVDLGDVVLLPPCTISGRVLDAAGTPTARVPVELKGWNEDRGARRGPDAEPATTGYLTTEKRQTDDLGRFVFREIAPGTYALRAGPPTQERARVEATVTADTPAATVEIRLHPQRTLRVVVRSETGEPVAGATARLYDRMSSLGQGETDADGTCVLDSPKGVHTLYVYPNRSGDLAWAGPLEVAANQTEIEVVLERAAFLRGRLVGPDGEPLGLASITFDRDGEKVGETVTDGDGEFTFRSPVGSEPVRAYFRGLFKDATQYGRWYGRALAAEALDVATDTTDLVLKAHRVAEDRKLSVRVLDPLGNPVEDIRIYIYPRIQGRETPDVRTDADGWARFENLPAVEQTLTPSFLASEERPWVRPELRNVVPAGQEVVLRCRAGARIEGTVVAGEGVEFEKVYVYGELPEATNERAIARPDESGRFVLIVDPDKGPYLVRAAVYNEHDMRYETKQEGIEPGRTGLTLHLGP